MCRVKTKNISSAVEQKLQIYYLSYVNVLQSYIKTIESIFEIDKLFWRDLTHDINNVLMGFTLLFLYNSFSKEIGDINKIIEIISQVNMPGFNSFVKDFLNSETGKRIINEIKEDKSLYDKINTLLSFRRVDFLIKTSPDNPTDIIYTNLIIERILNNIKEKIAYLRNSYLNNQINFMDKEDQRLKEIYMIVRNKTSIRKIYMEAINVLKNFAMDLHNHEYDNNEIKDILSPAIKSTFLFFIKEDDISKFIDLLLNSSVTSILNYLEERYLNKEYFETYLKESLNNLRNILEEETIDVDNDIEISKEIISNIFFVIKTLFLTNDLNENPRDYLNKIINYLGVVVCMLNEFYIKNLDLGERTEIDTIGKHLMFSLTFIIEGLTNSTLLKLIKYCSIKEQKDVKEVLKEVFNQFEGILKPYFDKINTIIEKDYPNEKPLDYYETMKDTFETILKKKGYTDILKRNIEKIEILYDFDFKIPTYRETAETISDMFS